MAGSPRRRLLGRVVGVAMATAVLGAGALADLAAADPPPGGGSLPPGAWIAFNIEPPNIPYHGTVSVVVVTGSTASPSDLWGATGDWPTTWATGGLTLTQVDPTPCTVAQHPTSSCAFNVSGNPAEYQNVLFGLGLTDQQVMSFEQSITVNPPPTTTTTQPPAPDSTFTGPGELTSAGGFTFTAPNQPGVTYTWTLFFNGARVGYPAQGPTYTPPPQIFSTPGTYTLRLTASNAVGTSEHEVSFVVAPPSPALPPPAPPPAPPSPRPSGGFNGPPTPSFTQVSFTPRLTAFATPKPGAVQPVTVIWLWRPDWFQATTKQKPRTGGRPSGVKRAAVSLGSNRGGPSATPWLAGLATFGIFGAAWLALRRRRVRTSILD